MRRCCCACRQREAANSAHFLFAAETLPAVQRTLLRSCCSGGDSSSSSRVSVGELLKTKATAATAAARDCSSVLLHVSLLGRPLAAATAAASL